MNDRTEDITQPDSRSTRELDARACESALWLALHAAQRAALPQLTDDIALLHVAAGDCRRRIEAGVA